MARASHGVHSGNYYFEVHILDTCSETSHFRIGWASRQAELEGPVGYDNHSFAYRDIDGNIYNSHYLN
jgi:Set1/Ash2 histone methyltransferase complex subunit ASH2